MLHILVNRDGRHLGPYTYDQACQLLAEGKLHAWDIAWPDGSREWVTLDQIDGLSDRAFALREQRRAEATASATAASRSSSPFLRSAAMALSAGSRRLAASQSATATAATPPS